MKFHAAIFKFAANVFKSSGKSFKVTAVTFKLSAGTFKQPGKPFKAAGKAFRLRVMPFKAAAKAFKLAVGAFALKTDSGLFIQASLMAEGNNILSQYGESVGIGYEPKQWGVFLFADALQYHLGDFKSTNHYQIRPAFRYHTDKFSLSLYYAHKTGSDQYLGMTTSILTSGSTQTTVQDQIFNETLSHGGFALDGIVSKRVSLHFTGDIAEKSVYRLQAGAEFSLGKGWSMTADFRTIHYGDYQLWTSPYPTSNTWEAFVGFSYRFGERRVAHEALAYRLLMATNYPIVVQRHAVSTTTKTMTVNHNPTIDTFTATPTTIYSGDYSNISGTTSDIDGDTVSWTLSIDPASTGTASFTGPTSGTGTISSQIQGANGGTVVVRVNVSDGHGGTATATVSITVQ